MKEKLRILKPKERPIQIEPWFFRYLNEAQIKLVAAIILHADARDRKNNSFPHNRTLAFYCGFGRIIEGTKTHQEYISLSEEDKKNYIKKKEKNAIQTVKNTKKSLEDLGVITREIIGPIGKQVTFLTLDLNWRKETYISDFNDFFNRKKKDKEEDEDVESMLNNMINMQNSGSSNDVLLKKLEELKTKLVSNSYSEHDLEIISTYIMNTPKIKEKTNKGEIKNPHNYKLEIRNRIKNNTYEGIDKTIKTLENEEKMKILKVLSECIEYDNPEVNKNNETYTFEKVLINDELIDVYYQFNKKRTIYKLSAEKLEKYTNTIKNKITTKNQQFILNYKDSLEKYKSKE